MVSSRNGGDTMKKREFRAELMRDVASKAIRAIPRKEILSHKVQLSVAHDSSKLTIKTTYHKLQLNIYNNVDIVLYGWVNDGFHPSYHRIVFDNGEDSVRILEGNEIEAKDFDMSKDDMREYSKRIISEIKKAYKSEY